MHRSEVEGKSLLITVLDSYVMKDVCEDTFFGQVKICLSETNLTHSKAHWYILDDKVRYKYAIQTIYRCGWGISSNGRALA